MLLNKIKIPGVLFFSPVFGLLPMPWVDIYSVVGKGI